MLAMHPFTVRVKIFILSFYKTEMLLFSGFQYKVLVQNYYTAGYQRD